MAICAIDVGSNIQTITKYLKVHPILSTHVLVYMVW